MYDMFGMKFTLGISRYVKMLTTPQGLVFLVLGVFLLFITDPNYLRDTLGPVAGMTVWAASALCYLTAIFLSLCLHSFLMTKFGPYPIYAPLNSAVVLLLVYIIMQTVIDHFTGGAYHNGIYPLFFNILAAILIIEAMFLRFVMFVIAPVPGEEEPVATGLSGIVTIGDRRFPVAKIQHILSQEHYLQVTLSNDTLVLRARLSDAIEQTVESDGVQPHRSWWVSAVAEPRLSKSDGRQVLRLSDGTEVPIAKARLSAVQQWLDLYSHW
ncbi:LytTR family DNA-binding domain-containing protein [Loktanella agnita]|uniref:LytTR family DNA-binding domain-containing protein n=1 Tax=Loktanella agnita TaxID=287097 RepID=UPI003986C84C